MTKYNNNSICQIHNINPEPDNLTILNFVYEPKVENYDTFITEPHYVCFVILSGTGTFNTDYKSYKLEKGVCGFIFPNKNFSFTDVKKLKMIYVSFLNPGNLLTELDIFYTSPIIYNQQNVLAHVKQEFNHSLLYNTPPQTICKSLLLYLISYCNPKIKENNPGKIQKNIIEKTINYINQNYNKDISLLSLCKQFHFSYNYLSQQIKKHTGLSFKKYLNELKLSHASSMLIETDDTVTNICDLVGFESYSYFHKIFKQKYNFTPNEYREKFKKH